MNAGNDKLGTMPIGRLLISMSIPMMISFFIQALYNIVDSMFVARISEDALTAVSIAFPMQQLITAIGVGTGVGATALVSRYTGQGDVPRAQRTANAAVFLCICYTAVFVLVGIFAVKPFYTIQTDVAPIVEDGIRYLRIICIVSAGAFFGNVLEKLLVATGNSLQSMLSQAAGAVFNIVFDPLLIFGIGPFPKMGVTGAAAATVAGQIVAALTALMFLSRKGKVVRIRASEIRPSRDALIPIFKIGVPSMITVGLSSAMSFGMNQILLGFSTTATAVFGIWIKLQNFSYMPIYGMNNGTLAIISYNYGARRLDRVRSVISLAMKAAIVLMLVLLAVFESIPGALLSLFNASENMLTIGITALRIAVVSLPFGAITLIFSSSFQALGRSLFTLILSLCRQVFFIIPIAWLLSLSGRLGLIWLAIPAAEAGSALLGALLRRKVYRGLGIRRHDAAAE